MHYSSSTSSIDALSAASTTPPSTVIMRFFTLRKVVIIAASLALVKLGWNLIYGSPKHGIMLDVTDLEFQPLDFNFQPKSCVMEDGVCKPFNEARAPVAAKGLFAHGDSFYLDGRPFRILSGSFHYFRTQPAHWGDRLLKIKAAGLNTVMTYIPWNLNEKTPGAYTFGGRWDLSTFIQQVQKVGLKLIVRPGPYICAEWEFGGLPSWLLRSPDMQVRSSHSKEYLRAVDAYFSKLLPMLSAHGHKNGGPIIAFQVENEFGSYGHDPKYLNTIKDMFAKYGIEELLFTSDAVETLRNGSLPGVLATVNFDYNPAKHFAGLQSFQPNKPIMVTEFWSGWFDHWGKAHKTVDVQSFEDRLNTILQLNASVNFYMFVGGTNFGFWNGANMQGKDGYEPTETSYDYDAPIAENGDVTAKLAVVRKLIMKYDLGPVDWIDVPPNVERRSYGVVHMIKSLAYTDMLEMLQESTVTLSHPVTMEQLDINNKGGQGYGWLLYRTTFSEGDKLKIEGEIHDFAQVILNGKEIQRIFLKSGSKEIMLPVTNQLQNTLDIFVENCGRVNYRAKANNRDLLDKQLKGIDGQILIDGKPLTKWTHVPFEFNHNMRENLKALHLWKPFQMRDGPAAYYGKLVIEDSQPMDTYIDTSHWGKGIVLVNGYNIGRYWEKGPQKRLYVPGPILVKGDNHIIVFELYKPHDKVSFEDLPNLG